MDQVVLDKKKKTAYVYSHKNTSTNTMLSRDMPYYLYKFNFEKASSRKITLTNRDVELFKPSIFLNPNNNDLLVAGMAGEKSTRKMNSNFLILLNKADLSFSEKFYFPISNQSIKNLQESKTFSDMVFQSSSSADFYAYKPLFDQDSGFYFIQNNRVGNGIYVLYYNESYKLVWQDYIIGPEGTKRYLKNDKLIIDCTASSKFMNKVYRENAAFQNATKDQKAIVRFTVDSNGNSIKVLSVLAYKESVISTMSLQVPLEVNCSDQIHLALLFGSSYNLPKTQFFILKPKID
jgi:hypothetical protein